MRAYIRPVLAVLLGNLLGYGLFRLAAWLTPQLWQGESSITFGELLIRIGITYMSFGSPPVMVGALAARVAGRWEPWIGLAGAAWGLTAYQWWPATVPLLPPESWIAPMTLILASGLVGGWLAGAAPPRPAPADSSKDAVI